MEAIRVSKIVKRDGEIRVTGLPFKRGQRIEVILLSEPRPEAQSVRRLTAKELLNCDLVGMWEYRTDVADSASYARELRDEAQNRAAQR